MESNYMRLKYYLKELLGKEVDLVIKGAEENNK